MESTSQMPEAKPSDQYAWDIACRWRQYEAEIRVNVVRVVAIGLFYLVHLAHYYSAKGFGQEFLQLNDGVTLSSQRHIAITTVVVAWMMYGLVVHMLLQDKVFPKRLPVLSICMDNLLLTSVLLLSNGAGSPILAGYFLIIIMSGLRLNLAWVWIAAGGAIGGYLFVLGCTRWPFGLLLEYQLPAVPRYHQVMVGLSLAMAGVIVGQSVRHVRRIAADMVRMSQQGASA